MHFSESINARLLTREHEHKLATRWRDETVTPAELDRDLGISKERVHPIEHKEPEKLRVLMACGIYRPDDLILE